MYGIIAAGPAIRSNGMMRHRVVLRVLKDGTGAAREFVVHTQTLDAEGNSTGFAHGYYFSVRSYDNVRAAFEAAFERWQERVKRSCGDFEFTLFEEGEKEDAADYTVVK